LIIKALTLKLGPNRFGPVILSKPEVIALERTPSSPIGPRNGLVGSLRAAFREQEVL
jgi:hypothetical protein